MDSTLAFLREGYDFVPRRTRARGRDIFDTRLLLQKTTCMTGPDAARLFYDPERFRREGAAPRRLKKTLFGVGGVQGLDGEAHYRRKAMFMSLMSPHGITGLAREAEDRWEARAREWQGHDTVVLLHEVRQIFCRAVCAWTGVPLPEDEVERRTGQLAAMIEASGAVGPRHWRGRKARRRAESWIAALVRDARAGELEAGDSALGSVARHREPDGSLLSEKVAAVEMLNILRPTVAVARFVVFGALALHEHPEWRERLRSADDDELERFVHEVRRVYSFFPIVAARVREDFDWNGHRFRKGRRVILDLYGTNRDPRTWDSPEAFRPERFLEWDGSAFSYIPQGGGDHHGNHRCPGEWITLALMKSSLRFLTRSISYDVPAQDLRISHRRIPFIPRSRFIISGVEPGVAAA